MKTLLCILPTLEKVDELTESLQDNVDIKIGNVLFVSELENYERVGFIYHQESKFPFLLGNEMNNFSGYYFSNEWIEYLRNQEKIVDLISCDYSRDIKDLLENREILSSIYYSTDTTGNTPIGDWILEKNVNGVDGEVSIKNIYFNDHIENWDVYLGVAYHSLIVDTTGNVYSFGYNYFGQLGLGYSSGSVEKPTLINDISNINIIQVSPGEYHSLILDSSGNVYSFGYNANGRTGLDTTDGSNSVPTKITTINNGTGNIAINDEKFIQISAGGDHSLVLDDNGNVYSFGNNFYGATGLNTTNDGTIVPTKITTINDEKFIQISAGNKHSLILDSNGNVYSFGSNANGRTGLDTTDDGTNVPTKITQITNDGTSKIDITDEKFIQISAGSYHSLILDSSNNVYGFGNQQYYNNNNESGNILVPFDISDVSLNEKTTQIYAGFKFSLFLDSDGKVYSIGNNSVGQLGIGNKNQSTDFNSIVNDYGFTIRAFNDSFVSDIQPEEEPVEEVTLSPPTIPEYNLRYIRNQVGKSSSDRINRLKRGCCNKPSNLVKKVDKCCVTPTRILRRNAKKREDLVVKTYCD